MKRFLTLLIFTLVLSFSGKASTGTITPVRLTCEQMFAPNCIDSPHPRLSWINAPINEQIKGAEQRAYQIRVASSREGLRKADLWDSRRVDSDQSLFIPYAGKPLQSGQQVWWQVRVWDQKGKTSPWSEPARWQMGILNPEEWRAEWIGAPWHEEWEKRNTSPAPLFRKEVTLPKRIRSAVAFVTGLGYFEFYVNGEKIGDEVLVPNFTNYTKRPHLATTSIAIEDNFRGYRVMYLTYDITAQLQAGENVLGMIVGNGWYNTHTRRWPAAYGSPRMLCQVEVTYEDGTKELILSDESWRVKESAIVFNDEYLGETYDARQACVDWCRVGCNDSSWQQAVRREAPSGELCASYAPLDRVVEQLKPLHFERTERGWEVDFGKEISGWLRFRDLEAECGDTLRVEYVCESPVGKQQYIFGEGRCEDYAPKFAWYVFRRAIIRGVELNPEQVVAEVVNTDVKADAEFTTSNPLLNQINTIWRRSLEDNLHGCVMSDCPHREKSPYTGDGQVCCETVMANYDCYTFYHKWLRDMRDAQNVESGHVPNSAPWQPGCGGGVGWGAAVNIIPWEMYRHFGDRKVLEDSYFAMTEQMRFMISWITDDGTMDCRNEIVNGDHRFDRWLRLGEWVAPHGLPSAQLVHTYFLWRCADITAKAASVLGHSEDEQRYRTLAEEVKQAFHKRFYNPEQGNYGDYGGNIFALHMGVPDTVRATVVEQLSKELRERYNSHLNTGIFGTRRLFEVLAQEGLNDLAYTIINQRDYPGFGWWIEQGATTTWERWDGKDSRNHPMFGGGLTWFYNTLAGVCIDENEPGYRHIIIRPTLVRELKEVCYAKRTPYGELRVEIQHHDFEGKIRVTIPVGSRATLYLPQGGEPLSLQQGTYEISLSGQEQPIYQTAAYTWYKDKVCASGLEAYAPTSFSIHSSASTRDGKPIRWQCRNEISAYGRFTGASELETALYNLATDELINNIEADGTLRTGALWGGVWTRDVSYSAILSLFYLAPQEVKRSLEVKIDPLGRIIQDTGTGGSWPCSSDRVIWAVAAWKVYLATGDQAWLQRAYSVIERSLESDFLTLYDKQTGLFRGESSFIDWRQQSYPTWMQPADIYQSECLGTNVVYFKVLEVMTAMAERLGEEAAAKEYATRAQALQKAINRHFWLADKGYYGNFRYGRNHSILSKRSETLGESLAILWGVADTKQGREILRSMPVSDWGPAIFWPQIASQPDYHNHATWPFVTSYWGIAAAKSGNQAALLHALGSNVRAAALYATNYENFTNSTGDPYTTKLNSHNMLWSLSGFLGLFHQAFFGFEFTPEGVGFAPCVPTALAGERHLEGFPYRDMLLDITVKGSGNRIQEFRLDGELRTKAWVDASLTGRHQVEILLAGDFSPAELPIRPYTAAPETPEVTHQEGTLTWKPIEGAAFYRVIHNGEPVAQSDTCGYNLPDKHEGEWQVIAVDQRGIEGFASEPIALYPEAVRLPIGVRIDEQMGTQIEVKIPIEETGEYALMWLYSNGNGSVTGYNMCATRSLYVDSERVGISLFPQRGKGDWERVGWSNPTPVRLSAGEHTVVLRYQESDVNMNRTTDNAWIRELSVVRIK